MSPHPSSAAVRCVALEWCAALVAALVLVAAPVRASRAQSYYELDGGRPGRVEDASPAARHELELQLLPVRVEQYAGGARRWRFDSKLGYGVAPFTEIELRIPLLIVDPRSPGSLVTSGIGGLAVGAMHAVSIETGAIPALAIAGELSLPVGELAAPVGSYSAKVIGTKTFRLARLHANVGYGTWSVRAAPVTPDAPPVIIPDTPCDRIPAGDGTRGASLACVGPVSPVNAGSSAGASAGIAAAVPRTVGSRWVAGVGVDHAFALQSTLLMADLVAERFIGLYPDLDWTAEVGVRRQISPVLVADAGVSRHFSGAVPSTAVTVGFSYGVPTRRSRATRASR